MAKAYYIVLILVLSNIVLNAQYEDKKYSLAVNAVYTTTAKIYLTPYSSDAVLKNQSFPLKDIFNPSIDFRFRLNGDLIIGIGTEYIKKTKSAKNLTVYSGGSTVRVMVEDGFKMVPVELSLYYLIPFSTRNFKFLMGGGGGYYWGVQIRKLGDTEVYNVDRKNTYGIHVVIDAEYMITNNISIRTEMKFRDPQFVVTSAYNKKDITYNGKTIKLAEDSFDSKINIDGVTFILGLAFQF